MTWLLYVYLNVSRATHASSHSARLPSHIDHTNTCATVSNTDHRNETRSSGMGDLALIAETTVSPRMTSCLVGSLIRSVDPGSKRGHPVVGRILRCWLGVRLTFSLLLVELAALAVARLRHPDGRGARLDSKHTVHRPIYTFMQATCCCASSFQESSHGSEISKNSMLYSATIRQPIYRGAFNISRNLLA
ncbi:hypothetical protein BDW22DRAFT_209803 [Trametopsis cervina]|nr:hypothetical protein BDW22DRAFT_209803 [Trametopsis cervina]